MSGSSDAYLNSVIQQWKPYYIDHQAVKERMSALVQNDKKNSKEGAERGFLQSIRDHGIEIHTSVQAIHNSYLLSSKMFKKVLPALTPTSDTNKKANMSLRKPTTELLLDVVGATCLDTVTGAWWDLDIRYHRRPSNRANEPVEGDGMSSSTSDSDEEDSFAEEAVRHSEIELDLSLATSLQQGTTTTTSGGAHAPAVTLSSSKQDNESAAAFGISKEISFVSIEGQTQATMSRTQTSVSKTDFTENGGSDDVDLHSPASPGHLQLAPEGLGSLKQNKKWRLAGKKALNLSALMEKKPSTGGDKTPLDPTNRQYQLAREDRQRLRKLLHGQQHINNAAMKIVNEEVARVELFFAHQSQVIASAAAACVDGAKRVNWMSPKDRKAHSNAFREVVTALEMLRDFCDTNVVALSEVLKFWGKLTHQAVLEAAHGAGVITDGVKFSLPKGCGLDLLKGDVVLAYHKAFSRPGQSLESSAAALRSGVNGSGGGGDDPGRPDENEHFWSWVNTSSQGIQMTTALLTGLLLSLMIPITTDFFTLGQPNGVYLNEFTWLHFTVPFAFTTMFFGWSCAAILWEKYGVNYVFMLQLDPLNHWTGQELLRNALIYYNIWALLVYAHLRTAVQEVQCGKEGDPFAYIWPYLIWPIYLVTFILFQTAFHPRGRRRWFVETLARIVQTPRLPVLFSDFIVTGFFVTLGTMLFEFQWLWCSFHQDSIAETCLAGRALRIQVLRVFPILWRLAQCWKNYLKPVAQERRLFPHGYNALKYFVVLIMLVANALGRGYLYYGEESKPLAHWVGFLIFYFVVRVADGCYRGWWDVMVDCGFKSVAGPDEPYKMREQLYPKPWYTVYCILDPFLRFMWIPRFFTGTMLHPGAKWIPIVWSLLAIFRRSMWLVFRLENEQVNNIELYKVTKTAPRPKQFVKEGTMDTLWDSATEELVLTSKPNANEGAAVLGQHGDNDLFGGMTRAESVAQFGFGDLDYIDKFFSLLPKREKIAIGKIAGLIETDLDEGDRATAVVPVATSTDVDQYSEIEELESGFAGLSEAMKVHVLIVRIGEQRTLRQYITTVCNAVSE